MIGPAATLASAGHRRNYASGKARAAVGGEVSRAYDR
jgi:hypothetical protein